jgi:hypothetical protein
LAYSASDFGWKSTDLCPNGRPILLRSVLAEDGEVFEVRSVSAGAFRSAILAVLISRNVGSLGERCVGNCSDLQFVAFEAHSFLCEIRSDAISDCEAHQSRFHPPFVFSRENAFPLPGLFDR